MLFLKRGGFIHELYDPRPSHRERILVAGLCVYLAGYGALRLVGAPPTLLWSSAAFIGGATLVLLINRFWKISIHSTGMGGAAILLLEVSGLWVLPGAAAVTLAVVWARLTLEAHTQSQVIAGIALGAIQAHLLRVHFM